jgi:hypothetical protein
MATVARQELAMPDEEPTAIVPSKTRPVDFYGEELVIALIEGSAYIALRPVADYKSGAMHPPP